MCKLVREEDWYSVLLGGLSGSSQPESLTCHWQVVSIYWDISDSSIRKISFSKFIMFFAKRSIFNLVLTSDLVQSLVQPLIQLNPFAELARSNLASSLICFLSRWSSQILSHTSMRQCGQRNAERHEQPGIALRWFLSGEFDCILIFTHRPYITDTLTFSIRQYACGGWISNNPLPVSGSFEVPD